MGGCIFERHVARSKTGVLGGSELFSFFHQRTNVNKTVTGRTTETAPPRGTSGSEKSADDLWASSVISIRHLSKSFGPVAALKDVSLDVRPGEILGICGENGAGKSTLVKILTGVYRPETKGSFWSLASRQLSRQHRGTRRNVGSRLCRRN